MCAISRGGDTAYNRQQDLVFRSNDVFAIVAGHRWGGSPGHVVVCPTAHYENLYELPDGVGAEVFRVLKMLAIMFKVGMGCDGVSTRQHNEPAGNQDVFHYHHHLFPRFKGDNLYRAEKHVMPADERAELALRLRAALVPRPPGSWRRVPGH
jgi:histidine triad (HIT) family protein